jgi:hypothetical protein
MKIKPMDIISALDHIDRYPTLSLTIKSIEHQLIRYFDQMINQTEMETEMETETECQNIDVQYLTDLCVRYGLKYLYLWIHNYKKRLFTC